MRFKRSIFVLAAALVGVLLTVQMFAAFNTAEAGQLAISLAEIAVVNAPVVIDDFNDGDISDWGFFGGDNAGGGGGAAADRPYEGSHYFSTGWGAGAPSGGFFGGAYKNFDNAAQPVLPDNAQFSVWVYNQSNANSDGYTLEITLREDTNGDGWTDGAEDSIRLDTTFTSADYNDQWVLISAPLSDFVNMNTGGNGIFDGNLDEVVIVIAGVPNADNGTTVEVDFDHFAFTPGTPPPVVIDDFNDGDVSDWGFFGGDNAGGGGGAAADRPYEGSHYFSTGWGAGAPSGGFFGGAYKNFDNAAQPVLPDNAQFSVWVYNQSNANSDGYTLEITLREDTNGDGWTDGAEDSIRLDTTFTSADYNDQWVLISAPLSDFVNMNTGGNGIFDGNLDEVVIVIAGVPNADNGTTVEVDFDHFAFTPGTPPPVVIDDFNDGDVSDWGFFGGDNAGGGGGAAADRPYEGSHYFSTGWGAGAPSGGFFGGAYKNFDNAAQPVLPDNAQFSVWVYNQSNANSDGYTLEITLREDTNGDGWTDGAEDSIRLDTTFTSADYNDQWVLISAPLSDFVNMNTGGNGIFDGNLDEVVIVIAGVPNADNGTTVEVDFDYLTFFTDVPGQTVQVAFDRGQYQITEGGTATVTATLSVAATEIVTVTYATSDGTAVAGTDYTAATGQLVFAPGETSQAFSVVTADNDINDDPRTVLLALNDPVNAEIGRPPSAVLTIQDNEVDLPSGKSVVLQDYENHVVESGEDQYGNVVGYDFFTDGSSTVAITTTTDLPAPVPGSADGNTTLREDLTIGSNGFSGFIYKFPNDTLDEWVTQDWQSFTGISFWLYGNNSGGVVFIDILDNRNPDSTTDDAGRWSIDIPDDFEGWRYFSFTWDEFRSKGVGNGAPTDGFNLDEIHGYAFGGFGSQPMDGSYYIDDIVLTQRVTMVDDFEVDMLPSGADSNSIPVGYYNGAGDGGQIAFGLTTTVPSQIPNTPASNQVLQLDLTLPQDGYAFYLHGFTNETADEWVPVRWESYEGVCFWLYGNNTGGTLFLDILDNRNPGSTADDAERYSVDIPDDFDGWQFFQYTWDELSRKEVGNGAPNDGLNLLEVHGYAIGGYGSVDMGQNTYYLDDFAIWGDNGADRPLAVEFERSRYEVTEGESGSLKVSLNRISTEPVTVTYRTAESLATPNVDFIPISGTLVFTPGVMNLVINLTTMDDAKHESNENIMIHLYDAQGAMLGFQRRATLTIVDNDAAIPGELGDFEGSHSFHGVGDVSLSITQLGASDPAALPGQGTYEQVLAVQYNDAFTDTNRIINTFKTPQDWSNADGLTFWYFGNNTGKTINVELWDNQITNTNSMTTTDWVLSWSDEFSEPAGTLPNPNNWKHEIGDGALNNLSGWGNDEFQYYTDDPANASTNGEGQLVLRMSTVNTATTDLVCYYGPCRYTSARLISADRAEFQYGKIEARIKLPPTDKSGLWPAFWALGTGIDEGVDWPLAGEIDIMEYVSRIPNEVFGTLHGPGYSGGQSYGGKLSNIDNLLTEFHTYAIEWRENHIIWYFDGIKFHETRDTDPFLTDSDPDKQWVYNQPFFLLLNVAIGGNFGGAIDDGIDFPQDTLVDYVRVYQAPIQAELFEAGFVDDFTGWKKVYIPFSAFTRSADALQPAGAPNDGLTLTSVNGYGFRFPSASTSVAAQSQVVAHIDQVRVVTFTDRWLFPLIFGNPR